jgi:quinol-cytochrome oxidoreductase complex cytochrome b subunit
VAAAHDAEELARNYLYRLPRGTCPRTAAREIARAHQFAIATCVTAALTALHVGPAWYLKHTQFPGTTVAGIRSVDHTERNVVGVRILPAFAAKSGAFFAATVGVITLMGGLFQINPFATTGRTTRHTSLRVLSRTGTC